MSENNNRKPRKKPTQKRAKATVEAIYEAALQLFVMDNYSAVTTDKIAERAGVSIGTLYQYFPNKESILVGMWDQVFDAVVIGGTTHSLHRSGIAGEVKAPEQHESAAAGNQGADKNVMKRIAGVYSGVFSGTVKSSTFNIKHQFDFQSTWTFDIGERNLKLALKDLPVLERIVGEGTVDPHTGLAEMVFKVPIMGKLPGTGRFDGGGSYSFYIPRVDFSISGVFAADGPASGTWKFNFSLVVLKVSAKGDMSGALKVAGM